MIGIASDTWWARAHEKPGPPLAVGGYHTSGGRMRNTEYETRIILLLYQRTPQNAIPTRRDRMHSASPGEHAEISIDEQRNLALPIEENSEKKGKKKENRKRKIKLFFLSLQVSTRIRAPKQLHTEIMTPQ